MTAHSSCPTALRRAAMARGLRVVKIREISRFYAQYGPYMLTDLDTNGVVWSGLELDDLAEAVQSR